MRLRGSRRIVLLMFGEAILLALTQQVNVLAGSRPNVAESPPVVLAPLQVTESDSGSQVSITADQPVSAYSIRQIGAWFELRIRNADGSRVQRRVQGAGFDDVRILQSGSDVVLLFRLQPGVSASVIPGVNRLEVNFFLPSRPANPSLAITEPENPTPVPIQRVANNPSLPPPSKLNFAATVIAPMPSLANDALLKPISILIADDAPPPLPRIAKNPPLPSPFLSRLNLAAIAPAPVPQFPGDALIPTSVLIVEETEPPPPPKPITKSQPPPSLRLNFALTTPAPTLTVTVDLPRLLPTVSLPDEPQPPPVPAGAKSENAATERAEPTEVDAANPATPEVATVTETENLAPVDPTKPAPAQINLPQAPLPRRRGRAPLSSERRFELSGVVSIDYSKTNQTTTPETGSFGKAIENRSHNFGIGLDMHLGTFLIDPRFLKLSFDSGFTTNRGGFDEFATRQGNKGAGLYIDFLPTSQYPFRFHFTRQNTHFLEQQISSASTGRRSLGFDWSLRKPHFPNLSVNFEDTSYASRFAASSSFKSQSKTLSISLTDKVKGWDVNSHFTRQSATEGITSLKTNLNFLRFDARRQLSSKSNLFVNSFFEKLHFNNPRTRLGQDFSFFDVHTDFSLQQTKKLSFRAAHQFYYSSNDQTATSDVPAPTSAASKSVSSFNSAQGQVNYRLWPALLISSTASARFISTPETKAETASRFLDFTAGVSWSKRLGFAETRASFVEGLTQVQSNFGQSRGVQFRSYSAGLSMGKVSRALVTADFNSTSRPDAFQIGGFFSQRYLDVAVETHAVSRFQIRASAGQNLLDYLTASGREHLRTTTYSLSLDDKWFTILLNHNANSGVRDVFLVPITLDNTRMFRVLPVDSLLRDPLLNGSGVFTLGLVRFKPRKGLDVEVRYLKDDVQFARTNNVFTRQFDILARYKLGQITLTSGLIFFQQDTEGLFRRDRNYFFFRLSRPFMLF